MDNNLFCALEMFFCLSAAAASSSVVRLRLFATIVQAQVSIMVVVLNVSPGSNCYEHRSSVAFVQPAAAAAAAAAQAVYFNGKTFYVLCRAHVAAITADVSWMQICSKWLTICHSFDNPSPPCKSSWSLSLPLSPFMSLSVYASISTLSLVFLPWSLQHSHRSLSLSLSLSLSPGACRGGFGLLIGGFEVSFLLWAVWQAVPQTPGVLTTTSTPTTMHTNRYGCFVTHTNRRTSSPFFLWSLATEFGCVNVKCVDGKSTLHFHVNPPTGYSFPAGKRRSVTTASSCTSTHTHTEGNNFKQ